jgi:predicted nucleotidyltransferase
LVEHGLVIADPSNRGFLYRLNRDHVLAEAVLTAARARTTLLRRMAESAAALRPEPVHVSVFGSFARGEAGPGSDIDVLIVAQSGAPHTDEWSDQVRVFADRVLAWSGNRVEQVTLTPERLRDLAEAREPIVTSWLDEAVIVHGAPLDALLHGPVQKRARRR